MLETIKERKAAARRGDDDAAGLNDLLAKIAEMPKADRVLAERIHAIVTANAPNLRAKTWYGMPAWARDGKLVCFFKAADKFKARYASSASRTPPASMTATAGASVAPDEAEQRDDEATDRRVLVKKAAG